MNRTERIMPGDGDRASELAPGIRLHIFAGGHVGAQGLTTCKVTMQAQSMLAYHTHPCSEAITVLEGRSQVLVEGRRYHLEPHDSVHVPGGVAHSVRGASTNAPTVLHTAFASEAPTRDFVASRFEVVDCLESDASWPEHVTRFEGAAIYQLAPQARFRDLFGGRFGARGICGGYGIFEPGTSLPCHLHHFDESITIVTGRAVCQVAGREYELSGYDTAWVPRGRPHRFINRSDKPMAMIWVYAGDTPDRVILDQGYCEGVLSIASLSDSSLGRDAN